MIDDAVGERERAHTRRLAGVGRDVGAGHVSEYFWRQRQIILTPILTAL